MQFLRIKSLSRIYYYEVRKALCNFTKISTLAIAEKPTGKQYNQAYLSAPLFSN